MFEAILSTLYEIRDLIDEVKTKLPGYETLEDKLRAAADWHHCEPRLADTKEIQALIKNGFDLYEDILPAVRAYAGARPDIDRVSWNYFARIIRSQEEKRLTTGKTQVTEAQREAFKKKVYCKHGTPQHQAWQIYYYGVNKPMPRDSNNGWYFDSEWQIGRAHV